MKKLKVGIIGVGIGADHIEYGYRHHPMVEISALADPDKARLAKVGAKVPLARCYESAEAMFGKEDLDLVSICTPNAFHHPLSLLALRHGAHVLCEKPMALNAAEAKEINAAAVKANRRLMIHFSNRFREQSVALKAEVDAGTFGDIYFGRTIWNRRERPPRFGGWFGVKTLSGGGPLIDLAVHRLDLALWLMGNPKPTWIMARSNDLLTQERAMREGKAFDVEDFAVATIQFENGAMLHLETSWALHQKEAEKIETSLYGSRGGFTQRNLNEGYQFESEIYTKENGRHFDRRLHLLSPDEGFMGIPYYVDAILNDRPHMATGEEGLVITEILDAIYKSAELKVPVQVCG